VDDKDRELASRDERSRLDGLAQMTVGVSLPLAGSIVVLAFQTHSHATKFVVFGMGVWCALPGILAIVALMTDPSSAVPALRIEGLERKRILTELALVGLVGALLIAAALAFFALAFGLRSRNFLTAAHVLLTLPLLSLAWWLNRQSASDPPDTRQGRVVYQRYRFWTAVAATASFVLAGFFAWVDLPMKPSMLIPAVVVPFGAAVLYGVATAVRRFHYLRLAVLNRRRGILIVEQVEARLAEIEADQSEWQKVKGRESTFQAVDKARRALGARPEPDRIALNEALEELSGALTGLRNPSSGEHNEQSQA
jgi:hypothetical protein